MFENSHSSGRFQVYLGQLMEVRMTSEQSSRKHNLPASVSSFIGRELELREIQQCLSQNRLITLTGVGGIGKTRLALQAATKELDHFSDGVWLIDLATLTVSELVLETIAKVLMLPEAPDPAPIEQLAAYLSTRHLLLLLDNCEHVIEECARIGAFLLMRCPRLTLLTTSREPLTINGELVLRIPALSLPDKSGPLDTRLHHYDALRLFVERARAAEPSFQLTDDNVHAVIEICRHLDCIPLALELAAVRVRGMGVARLSIGLDLRFQLLTSGDRTALPRQQTLHAMIDWSYRLLPEPEQIVLRRLGIFVGAFELQAAESICSGAYASQNGQEIITPETILPHLLQLVNKSLVQFNQESNRYRLLETIRFFSLERLAETGETQSLHNQHFAWYLRLAEHAAPNLSGPQQEAWFTRLEVEHENMRTALEWAFDEGEVLEAARLALALWRFWHTHTYQREGLRWLERIRALDAVTPLPPTLRPRLFNALGVLSHSLRQFDRATFYHTEALRLWKALDDREGQAQALLDIGWQQLDEMKLDQAGKSARESVALARAEGDHQAEARALLLGGLTATESDLVEEAIPALEEGLAFFREVGDTASMALAMATLARAEGKQGNDERVKPLLREAVRLLVQLGNFIYLVSPLVALGFMAMHSQEQPEGARSAAQVFGMLATWSEKLGGTSPWDERPLQQTIEQLTAMLGADPFAQAFEVGKQMTPADLVRLAEQITAPAQETILSNPPRSAPAHSRLTAREVEVLHLVATGLTNAQIAHHLSVTPRTVNAHLTAIYRKLDVSSRSGAIRYALDHQLG
jgi:predicted ATPase/DNA-binding CsgD family transcriptional regulator